MSDVLEQLHEGFLQGLSELPDDLLSGVPAEKAYQLGRKAARAVVAPAVWERVAGFDRLNTSQVAQLLGVTRQAIAKRVASGSLIGLPGEGTTYFPTWQFDLDRSRVRNEVRAVVDVFREELDSADPYVIAAWATTRQTEDLDGASPAEAISKGWDLDVIVEAARRAAARLAV